MEYFVEIVNGAYTN